jgi:hypothetical protein
MPARRQGQRSPKQEPLELRDQHDFAAPQHRSTAAPQHQQYSQFPPFRNIAVPPH